MELKEICSIFLSLILFLDYCSSYQDGHRSKPIEISTLPSANVSGDILLPKNSQDANEVVFVNPTSNSPIKGHKSGKMGMAMGAMVSPLAILFGAKAIFLKKFLIGTLFAQKCCSTTTPRPAGGVNPLGAAGAGGIPGAAGGIPRAGGGVGTGVGIPGQG